MSGLIQFMNGTAGRVLRVILGLGLIYIGLAVVGGTVGLVIAIVGVLPIAFGLWGRCALQFVFK